MAEQKDLYSNPKYYQNRELSWLDFNARVLEEARNTGNPLLERLNFLGITQCFLTNKVPSGTLYVTPAENIHAYGLDFSELATAGFEYQSDDSGLIGVYHEVDYGRVSAVTNAIMGALFVPEVTDYIVKGTIATA